jgi:hypothetical protein
MKILFIAALFLTTAISAAETKPKYGPEAQTLSHAHEFFMRTQAPDFWALIPYYLPQQDDASCSLASATMVVNAARAHENLGSEDQLATEPEVLKKAGNDYWKSALGPLGRGVTLDHLKDVVGDALKAYGVQVASIEVVHEDDTSEKTMSVLHQALVQNEKSDRDFIIANFNQGVFTGDADAGHIAPVAAYDAKTKRVLILDPDRKWYEPYWVKEATFLKGMATLDPDSKRNRGFIWIKLK